MQAQSSTPETLVSPWDRASSSWEPQTGLPVTPSCSLCTIVQKGKGQRRDRGGSGDGDEHKTELSLKSGRGKEKGNSANHLLESAGPVWVDLLGGGRGAACRGRGMGDLQ